MNNSEFLTPAEAADYLKICKATIYKMIKTGKGAVKKLPKKKDCHLARKARQQSFFVV